MTVAEMLMIAIGAVLLLAMAVLTGYALHVGSRNRQAMRDIDANVRDLHQWQRNAPCSDCDEDCR